MAPLMRWDLFLRIWFVIYCLEAGLFLVLAPWSPAWERTLLQLPFASIYLLALHPALRGAVSGFGLMHLVWGAHDLDDLLLTWRRTRDSTA
jgi:hypothetical protein